MTSFTADKHSLKWLRDYLAKSLQDNREKAIFEESFSGEKYGGWSEEKYWIGWQEHMETLINRLDALIAQPENQIELVQPQETELDQSDAGMTM